MRKDADDFGKSVGLQYVEELKGFLSKSMMNEKDCW